MADSSGKESLSPAVNSAVDILELLAKTGRPLGTADIARGIGRAKSTASNIVLALEQSGLVERHESNGYQLGRKLVELGGAYLAQTDLVADFHRAGRSLPVAKNETLSLSSLKDDEIVYLAHHSGNQPVRWFANFGSRLPVVATAMGISMLSTMTDDELDEYLEAITEYPELTEYSYRSESEFREVIAKAKEDGYAVGDQLNTLGLCSFARPMLSEFDDRLLAVGVTLLSARVTPDLQKALLDDLATLAELLPPAGAA